MPKNNHYTKFVPAGHTLNFQRDQKRRKASTKASSSENTAPHRDDVSTKPEQVCLTPKSICKNKSLPIENFNININEHVVLQTTESPTPKQAETSPQKQLSIQEKLQKLKAKKVEPKTSTPLFNHTPPDKKPTITKKINNKFLLHSPIILKPVFSLDQMCVQESVHTQMQKLNWSTPKDMQSIMWPSVQRGLNIIMVGPESSGKTLSFLPTFCSLALDQNNVGNPSMIVLCSDLRNCEEVYDLARSLIPDSVDAVEMLTEDCFGECKCEILITIPKVLELNLKSGCVSLENLRHVAIEDAHVTLKSQSTENLLMRFNDVQYKRLEKNNMQIIVSSKKWSVDLLFLLRNLHVKPLVYFEDFLEAAMYCKIQFKKKKIIPKHKCFHLKDILDTQYMTHKTVVFANHEHTSQISEFFTVSGIEHILISNNLIEDEIFENEDMWNSLQNGSYKVLLCTDSVFVKTVNILNAHWLIHYDLPTTWPIFQRRHRALAANFQPPLEHNDSEDLFIISNTSIYSYLLLNEDGENQLYHELSENLALSAVPHLKFL